jgi:PIN domain nuclease of toxin-antitoxin system
LGKLHLPEPPGKYIPSRMAALDVLGLPIEHAHALRVFELPAHHRDPFDRILIAQAQMESLTLLTADSAFSAYDVETFWAGRTKRQKTVTCWGWVPYLGMLLHLKGMILSPSG